MISNQQDSPIQENQQTVPTINQIKVPDQIIKEEVENQKSDVSQKSKKSVERAYEPPKPIFTVPFTIISATSYDKNYPPSNLAIQNSQTSQLLGWRTQRFCIYPQEIVFEFPSSYAPFNLKEIIITSHQFLISKKVEIRALVLVKESSLLLPMRTEKKVGSCYLGENSVTNYTCRERKTLYVDIICQGIKLIFFGNYKVGSRNPFQQIGVQGVQFKGRQLAQDTPAGKFIIVQGQEINSRINPSEKIDRSKFDPDLLDRIDSLQNQKQEAVKNQDYDLAKQLKKFLDQIYSMMIEISQIEDKKRVAIIKQNYDEAKSLKYQIESLKRKLIKQIDQIRPNEFELDIAQQHAAVGQDKIEIVSNLEGTIDGLNISQIQDQQEQRKKIESTRKGQIIKIVRQKQKIQEMKQRLQQNLPFQQKPIEKILQDQKGKNQFGQQIKKQGQDEQPKLQDLTSEKKVRAQPLLGYINKDIVQKIMSSHWQFRNQGAKQLKSQIPSVISQTGKSFLPSINSILIASTWLIMDRIVQVSSTATQIVCELFKKLKNPQAIIPQTSIDKIIATLLSQSTQSRTQKQQQYSLQTIKCLLNSPCTEGKSIILQMQRDNSFMLKGQKISSKQLQRRIDLYIWYISNTTLPKDKKISPVQIKSFSEIGAKSMQNASKNLRMKGKQLLKSIYKLYGIKSFDLILKHLGERDIQALRKQNIDIQTS